MPAWSARSASAPSRQIPWRRELASDPHWAEIRATGSCALPGRGNAAPRATTAAANQAEQAVDLDNSDALAFAYRAELPRALARSAKAGE